MRIWWFLILLTHLSGEAGDRALIIGVDQYAHYPRENLESIRLDVEKMREVSHLLGYEREEITVLQGPLATHDNIIKVWGEIVEQIREGDRLLFYFSGHGLSRDDQDGDEADAKDEILCFYDFDASGDWSGYLRDDELGVMLSRLRSSEVTVILDACFTGTATRSLSRFTSKRFPSAALDSHEEHNLTYLSGKGSFEARGTRERYISLSACLETEIALIGPNGSLFTNGIYEILMVNSDNPSLTYYQLREGVQNFIIQYVGNEVRAQHPSLGGDINRFSDPIFPQRASQIEFNRQMTRDDWEEIVELANYTLEIKTNEYKFNLGDSLTIEVANLPGPGFLNVINVGPDGKPIVLFPNKFHTENKIEARHGKVTLPSSQYAPFEFIAREPIGNTRVYAFYTTREINFYTHFDKGKDAMKLLSNSQASQARTLVRSFVAEQRDVPALGVGRVELQIKRPAQ